MQVRDIMTQPVVTTPVSSTIQEAARLMAHHRVGALVACDADRIVGIVTDRDLVRRFLAATDSAATATISAVMTRHPITISPRASIEEAAQVITAHGLRRLPVVEEGRPIGMLSADDIARFCPDDMLVAEMERALATYMQPATPMR